MDYNFEVKVLCLFCQMPLQVDKDTEYESGDMIKCVSCGEFNDFDSVFEVAKEEGIKLVKNQVEEEFNKEIKKLFS